MAHRETFIKHIGRLPHCELALELGRHDVLVLPSRFDSFGMVVAEAMACGLPAIVSDNVGAQELVTPFDTGLIVPTGDAAALSAAMRWFADHKERLPAMSAAARRTAERFDWRHYRRNVVKILNSVKSDARRTANFSSIASEVEEASR